MRGSLVGRWLWWSKLEQMSAPRRRNSPPRPAGPARRTRQSGGGPSARGGLPAPKGKPGVGGEQVEGRQAVRELLLAGARRVRQVWVADDLDESEIVTDILDLAAELRVTVIEVPRRKLDAEAHTEAPQGVLAKAAPIPEAAIEDLATRQSGEPAPFLVMLDGVTDPGNLGAVLRSAACAGVTGVVLPRHRSVHVTPTVAKAAAGAVEYLPLALVGGLPAAITFLREKGVWVFGLDGGAKRSLYELPPMSRDEPVALVLGAEGSGLSRLVRQRCDELVSIPVQGPISSLNVAAASSIACFEVARRRLTGTSIVN
jgi:23S rRNA (guanosine2251-2'-O)-methyltransferase